MQPMPMLPGLPLLGSALDFQKSPLGVYAQAARLGDLAAFKVGPLRFVFLNAPALVEELYVRHPGDVVKGPLITGIFGPMLGKSLFTSDGALHDKQRKLIAPKFSRAEIERFLGLMVSSAQSFAKEWSQEPRLEFLSAAGAMGRRTLGAMLFSDQSCLASNTPLGIALEQGRLAVDHLLMHPLSPPPIVPTARNRAYKAACRTANKSFLERIRARRDAPPRADLLNTLVGLKYDDGSRMSDEQLADEVSLIVGAHETLAVALSWTVAALTENPAVYDQLLAEVDAVLGRKPATLAHLEKLPLTQRVWKEALRLRPPTPGLIRHATRSFTLGGFQIKKGDLLTALPWMLGRRADIFPETARFDPDRFLPERAAQLPPYSYIPFGVGDRSCVGEHLIGLEGPLALATICQAVRFSRPPFPAVEPEVAFSIRPKGGLEVEVSSRLPPEEKKAALPPAPFGSG